MLADDDEDDITLFRDVLDEIGLPVQLTVVHNGEQLMERLLDGASALPDILFLDLNMPRKNGLVCLPEIKNNGKLSHFPVILYSTSLDADMIDLLWKKGASYYIRKPNEYNRFKKVIELALTLTAKADILNPARENFVLSVN